jgi:hypothetical protein
MWALLIVTLPTRPNAVRVRIWRALKVLGCAALRDGAYLLPGAQSARFDAVAAEVRAHGGTAMVLALQAVDEAQATHLRSLFDRSEAYAAWRNSAQSLAADLPGLAEAEARRRCRTVAEALAALQQTDHYPGPAAQQALDELSRLQAAVAALGSPGEPRAAPERSLALLDRRRFQGKRWATRARPRVDRLACAWLILRFIDPQARFVWLADPAGRTPPPRGALGFDFEGARFTHAGSRVSFEVLLASFGLDDDVRLRHVAALVHVLDVGGIPMPEAAGLERVLAGLRALHTDDDTLVAAAAAVFDALIAAPTPDEH